ncbi:hypothetical protein BGY98DRAFT_1192805 [Russula aff. rugulosa BPL654]|nr:hypothetical protein BGY98DRAFT_1192805 [Russula aff. rugulosa BPL654]
MDLFPDIPARYRDVLPEPAPPAASTPTEAATSIVSRISLIVRNPFRTAENTFGLWKEYLYRPSYDPDAFISVEDLYRPHLSTIVPDDEENLSEPENLAHSGYSSKTAKLLMDWQNTEVPQNRTEKSIASYTRSYFTQNFDSTLYNLVSDASGGEDSERVYSEMYNSDVFLDEHDRVQRAPTDDPSCKREKVMQA